MEIFVELPKKPRVVLPIPTGKPRVVLPIFLPHGLETTGYGVAYILQEISGVPLHRQAIVKKGSVIKYEQTLGSQGITYADKLDLFDILVFTKNP